MDKQEQKISPNDTYILLCERRWFYLVLAAVAGFFGAFTYLLRGNIFCNAQTGNIVLMGMALGDGEWRNALYYLIPISAYVAGAMISELLPNPVKHHLSIRWDTLLIAIEMAVVLFLGFLPESAPVQVSQISINFIASMQYNTFRQSGGVPMATTFVTNHIRQVGVGLAHLAKELYSGHRSDRKKLLAHAELLLSFFSGSVIGTIFCRLLLGKAILVTLLPLGFIFIVLLHADLTIEKEMKEKKPAGH